LTPTKVMQNGSPNGHLDVHMQIAYPICIDLSPTN
jgi:hypothetical protein